MLKPKINLFHIFILAGILVLGVFFVLSRNSNPITLDRYRKAPDAKLANTSSLSQMAKEVVAKCSGKSYKPTCYEEEVPRLMNQISMRQAFDVTRLVQQQDPSYTYCHVLGHKLSANEVAKDPAGWLDVVNMCPSGTCSNGCVHGAFQEKFRAESLTREKLPGFISQIQNVCEPRPGWNPTGLEQGTCYHALGHLLMYVTEADIQTAVGACDTIAQSQNSQRGPLCYDGAFMQIFQPLETEDFALVEGKQPSKAGLKDFCSKYSGEKQASCWSEGWPLYRKEIMTSEGVVKFCGYFKSVGSQNSCYNDLFYVVTAQVQFDTSFMKNYCSKLPFGVSGRCFASAASRLIETDYGNIEKSVGVCKSATRNEDQEECFKELVFYSTFNFHRQSSESLKLCNSLPAAWKEKCLQN